ncbi:E3 SUMO-protein ligase PIAS2 isoform X4 [Wyeomyia smithii]|uniref:E3 SUMO-protein ligase PIAS2 isoform X3 n=1 Tax=Wyeomyia smithii TaxID=174621 RepID=UPI002467D7F7|nr:E3 SUMO-protein ligase PIAS2 isoform X3 [Wyeomyia smithii]XP_055540328.1 E3 SUMO-protein ligase PIAS2 isoform X4 [Wyeomyia smithii]
MTPRSLNDLVHQLRVSDLQQLLGEHNISRSGRKSELIERVLILVRQNISVLKFKVRELHKKAQEESEALLIAPEKPAVPSQPAAHTLLPSPPIINTPVVQSISRATPSMYQQQYANAVQNDNRGAQVHANGIVPIPYPETTPNPGYPIHPDVKLKKLAFFDVLATLLKPATLVPSNTTQRVQEGSFFFHLTPQQATDIATNRDIRNANKIEHTIQVQLRFCLLETSCEQEDYFPPNIAVKVNNKLCPLPNPIPTNKPGVEPKRPPRPVNITPNVKLSPLVANHIAVSWCTEYNRGYAAACYLVRKLTSNQLLQRMKTKGVKPADYTRALIKEKLNEDADCEIATTMLKVSLICPLGKMRMSTPCRSSTCSHLQCFDASLYLQMNERKPTWNCPVCDKAAVYDNLVIDGYFQEVLASNKLSGDDNEIQLHKDGSWSTHVKSNDTCALDTPSKPVQKVEVISDDIEVITTDPPKSSISQASVISSSEPTSTTAPSADTVDLTLSDSDDDLPLKRKTVTRSTGQGTGNGTIATITSTSNTIVNQQPVTTISKPKINEDASQSVISLDSPSPPSTPNPPTYSDNVPSMSNNVSSTTTSTTSVPYQLPISPLEQASNLQLNPLAMNRFEAPPDDLQSYIYNRLINEAHELSYLSSQWNVQNYMHMMDSDDIHNSQRN